jgi:hypothetical protein
MLRRGENREAPQPAIGRSFDHIIGEQQVVALCGNF